MQFGRTRTNMRTSFQPHTRSPHHSPKQNRKVKKKMHAISRTECYSLMLLWQPSMWQYVCFHSWLQCIWKEIVCLLVACLTSQQQASVSQGWICSDNFMCCHTEIEVADQTFYLTQSQYIDTGPTSPSADPIMPGAWQGSHWRANF